MIEQIVNNDSILSIIIRANFCKDGIEFFTPDTFCQQLGYMNRAKGYLIEPHVHNIIKREVFLTQEVLFIKSGKVRIDYYDEDKIYLESKIVTNGDVIILAKGGHGFYMLEQSEIIEVKQGPYCGESEKTRFKSLINDDSQLIFKN
jgi:hypothetical protein